MPSCSKMIAELVDERDVDGRLRVLDHLGRLGDLDRRRAIDARLHHRAVQPGDLLEGVVVVARHDLENFPKDTFLVARVDALGRIADMEVLPPAHARAALEDRHAHLLGTARVHGRLVDHDRARLHVPADGLARRLERPQVGLARGVDRRRHRDDDEIRVDELGRIRGRPPVPRPRELGAWTAARYVHAASARPAASTGRSRWCGAPFPNATATGSPT